MPTAKYGNRNVPKMYGQINTLRALIRSEGSPAIQEAWDEIEPHIDFIYVHVQKESENEILHVFLPAPSES